MNNNKLNEMAIETTQQGWRIDGVHYITETLQEALELAAAAALKTSKTFITPDGDLINADNETEDYWKERAKALSRLAGETQEEMANNQRISVKYLPPTNTMGARFSVTGKQGRKILAYNYAARDAHKAAAIEYLAAINPRGEWQLTETGGDKRQSIYWAYSLAAVEIAPQIHPTIQQALAPWAWTN